MIGLESYIIIILTVFKFISPTQAVYIIIHHDNAASKRDSLKSQNSNFNIAFIYILCVYK
jgi:hypothetical protein